MLITGIEDFTAIFIVTEAGLLDSTYVPGLELYFGMKYFIQGMTSDAIKA